MRHVSVEQESGTRRGDAGVEFGVPLVLLTVAGAGWWWSARMAADTGDDAMGGMGSMTGAMSLGGFVVAWVAMMAAMMLPAILPVVRLYALAAARGRAAPTGFFALGYLGVWAAMAGPAYVVWQELEAPLADGRPWVARVAGATFLTAAVWQVSPLKAVCLQHCRSPLGFFLRFGGTIRRPTHAARMGATHGAFCLGCCWALFAVLLALGTMNLAWMVGLTALIVLEKNAPHGEAVARAGAVCLATIGALLVLDPSTLVHLT